MPYRRPVNVVVGRPIMVERQEKPKEEYVDEIHGLYIKELMHMWDSWKDQFAPARSEELRMIE